VALSGSIDGKEERVMRALTPWTGMNLFRGEMDRLFDRLFEPRMGAFEVVGEWMPKLDLSETKDAYVAKLEVPGVEPRDINVSVREGLLVITGEKTRETEEKNEKVYRMERAWGAFTRTIPLPGPVDTEKTTAAFKDGVLTVTLPKTMAAKGNFIPVKAG
jgi:HSP20 family protein